MKHSFKHILTAFAGAVLFMACEKDPIVFDTITPSERPELAQYGTPLEDVPATADINMYEANITAMSTAGDLAGVTARLDHLQDLGINVLWLMPIHPVGQEKASGSPYAVKDYYGINSKFGDLTDLRNLVDEAHNRGIAVILDWVANHTAWDNAWTANKSWYDQDADGNIVSPNDDWSDVASLNYNSDGLRAAMIEAMKYWVLEANIDGFRCDYAEGVPNDFWSSAINQLNAIPGRDLIFFAEGADKELLNNGFQMTFGWDFYHDAIDVYTENFSAGNLFVANGEEYTGVPDGDHIVRWTTNHDDMVADGTPQAVFGGQGASVSAFASTALLSGVPLVYSGQEVAITEALGFFDGNTVKIDWSNNDDVLANYTEILNFRLDNGAARNGALTTYTGDQDILAFEKQTDDNRILVLINVHGSEVNYTLPTELANSTWTNYATGQATTLGTSVTIGAYEYLLLVQ